MKSKVLKPLSFYGNHYGKYLEAMLESSTEHVVIKELTASMGVSERYIHHLKKTLKFKKFYLFKAAEYLKVDISDDFPEFKMTEHTAVVNEPSAVYGEMKKAEEDMFNALKKYLQVLQKQSEKTEKPKPKHPPLKNGVHH